MILGAVALLITLAALATDDFVIGGWGGSSGRSKRSSERDDEEGS